MYVSKLIEKVVSVVTGVDMNEIGSRIKIFQRACIDKLASFNYTNFTKPIYHYTNFQNFISILDTQTIYFTSSKLLNDTNELTHGFKIIKDIIYKNNFPKSDHCLKVLSGVLKRTNFYISSFSTIYDNLSLWRLYGADGHGIVLGIDANFYSEDNHPIDNPTIASAIYEESILRKTITSLCNKIQKIANSHIFKQLDNAQQEHAMTLLGLSFSSTALSLCLISKNKSFEHEGEVRLLLNDGDTSHLTTHPNGFNFPTTRFIHYKRAETSHQLDEDLNLIRHSNEKSKTSLCSAKLKKDFLKEVWIGSKLDDNQKSRIQTLLVNKGYSANLIVDKVSLPY